MKRKIPLLDVYLVSGKRYEAAKDHYYQLGVSDRERPSFDEDREQNELDDKPNLLEPTGYGSSSAPNPRQHTSGSRRASHPARL
jgi:hypothetical protein